MTAVRTGTGTLEENVEYLLKQCPHTVWQRPGAGPVDLIGTLCVTFLGMQYRLQEDPMYKKEAKSC